MFLTRKIARHRPAEAIDAVHFQYWISNNVGIAVSTLYVTLLIAAFYGVVLLALVGFGVLLKDSAIDLWEHLDAKNLVFTGASLIAILVLIASLFQSSKLPRRLQMVANEQGKLHGICEEVSRRMGAGKATMIVLVPGFDVFVSQRTRFITAPFYSERILVIGLLALEVLSVGELQAVLGHEFAHFKYRDPVIIRMLYRVISSAQNLSTIALAGPGDDSKVFSNWAGLLLFLPVMVLVVISKFVLFLTLPYQRRMEIRADYSAAAQYSVD